MWRQRWCTRSRRRRISRRCWGRARNRGCRGVQESCTVVVGFLMATETSYTALRENLASVLDRVVDDQETVIVRRKGGKDVALVPATELASLTETDRKSVV